MANNFTYFHEIQKKSFSSGLGFVSTNKPSGSMVSDT